MAVHLAAQSVASWAALLAVRMVDLKAVHLAGLKVDLTVVH